MVYYFPKDDFKNNEDHIEINFEDLLIYFHDNVNPEAPDQIIAQRHWLRRLASQKDFLKNIVSKAIERVDNPVNDGFYSTGQSIVLGHRGPFVLRLNFWNQPSKNPAIRHIEMDALSYERAHDHNFNLLTIGCFGPGYVTDIFSYNRDSIEGKIGEEVALNSEGSFQLEVGDLLFFESCKDVHIQHIPTDFSVSLNLIAQTRKMLDQEQFFFDTDKKNISGYVEAKTTRIIGLLNIAKNFKSIDANIFKEISESNKDSRIKNASYIIYKNSIR